MLPESIEAFNNIKKLWPQMVEHLKKNNKGVGRLFASLDFDKLPTRAHMVKATEDLTLKLYEDGDFSGYELVSMTRGGRGYGEAGLSLASAIWNDKYEIHGPDVRSCGTIPGLDPNYVATTTALVNKSGIYPMAVDELPKHIMSFILAAKNYELLAIEAATTGNYHAALEALIANPLIVSFEQAQKSLNALLVAHKEFLPLFKESIEKIERGDDPLK
jgi:6-phospho-beta-glucosidase